MHGRARGRRRSRDHRVSAASSNHDRFAAQRTALCVAPRNHEGAQEAARRYRGGKSWRRPRAQAQDQGSHAPAKRQAGRKVGSVEELVGFSIGGESDLTRDGPQRNCAIKLASPMPSDDAVRLGGRQIRSELKMADVLVFAEHKAGHFPKTTLIAVNAGLEVAKQARRRQLHRRDCRREPGRSAPRRSLNTASAR